MENCKKYVLDEMTSDIVGEIMKYIYQYFKWGILMTYKIFPIILFCYNQY